MTKYFKILKEYILKKFKKDINFENDFTLAVSLGNILYQNIRFEYDATKRRHDYNNPLCVKKIIEEKLGQVCGGFQICYFFILKAFNIKCNKISIYTDKQISDKDKNIMREKMEKSWVFPLTLDIEYQLGIQHGHAITEFLYKDKYIIFDPTYNCLYKYKNKYIDHKELRDINNDKNSDKITCEYFYNENKQLKHKITDYPVEIKMYKNVVHSHWTMAIID